MSAREGEAVERVAFPLLTDSASRRIDAARDHAGALLGALTDAKYEIRHAVEYPASAARVAEYLARADRIAERLSKALSELPAVQS